jgi:hypothetical protein
VFVATGGDAHPHAVPTTVAVAQLRPVAEALAAPCCLEIVTAAPARFSLPRSGGLPRSAVEAGMSSAVSPLVTASRYRVDDRPLLLPLGVAPEHGLQVKTILTSRSISAAFPEIHSIGGVRPDGLRWHPDGLALDVMIPNPGSVQGIALGNEIVAYVLKNATRFGMQDAIWRGTYYTPSGPRGGGMGHFDHVHITTLGGGYPTGSELYYR